MKRALLVDDKEENLSYLSALLSTRGFGSETAFHGVEADAGHGRLHSAPPMEI
jgi:CheY-like chemotaxis protein